MGSRHSIGEKRAVYVEELASALDKIVADLSKRPEVHRVILFGSYASSHRDLFTDLDLLVVLESSQDFATRTAQLYNTLHAGVDLDLIVYTPEEFERMRERGFLKHALKNSQVLYEK